MIRSLPSLRKTAASRLHHLQRAEETSYQLRTTPSGGKVVGITTRSHWQDDKVRGEDVAVFGAELDSAGKLLKGGEINLRKSGNKESVESKGSQDPRDILKSFNIPIPPELSSLNFQVTRESIDPSKLK